MDQERLKQEISGIMDNLRRFAFSLTGEKQDAYDLLQETIVRLLEKNVPDDADTRKWAFRVCKNIWLDQLRANKVRRQWAESKIGEMDNRQDGQKIADDHIALEEVKSIMAELPDEQRTILSLVAVEGFSYKEAAEMENIPVGTVMSRLSRARAAIADSLNQGRETVH
ncbi:RNA polymerase sigma factor [Parasphingorhabdus sp.]|uniref:RNA polymerase sigma factor n=1 Tax=Parasphingorhabdus sp. TaxID=2709688 RepID=UPI003BAF1BF6